MAERSRVVPRKKPRQERSKVTVDAMLEAAAHILVHEGFEGATTRRVAHVAGVSIGSLYQYFPNKEALVAALVERQVQRVLEVCTEVLQPQGSLPVREVALRLAQGLLKVYAVNPRLYQVLLSEGLRLGVLDRVQDLEQRIEVIVRGFLLQYRDQLRTPRLELAVFLMMRATRGVIWAAAIERPHLFEDPVLAEELSELMVGYLLS